MKVEDELNPGERAGSEEVKKTTTDEPHETQVSALPDPNDDHADVDSEHVVGDLDETTKKLQKFSESRRALYHVLDDHLAGKSWDLKVNIMLAQSDGVWYKKTAYVYCLSTGNVEPG